MAWDTTTHRLITTAWLRLAAPDVVYQALEEYGEYYRERGSLGDYEPGLEEALAERDDRLIDLGLAKNAATNDLVARLYQRSLKGTGDPLYDKAVRLACLSNRMAAGMLFSSELAEIDKSEFRRLALVGDDDELAALMRNPTRRGVLRDVYSRKEPIEDISDDRWHHLVRSSVGNPGLNTHESDSYGPDLLAWDIQKSVVDLLSTAPVEPMWVHTLYSLLLELNPAHTRSLGSEVEALALLERWKAARVPKMFEEEGEETGYYSSLTLVEEFCCLMAALYGRIWDGTKFICIGKPEAKDPILRCAYYGRAEMTPKQMQEAYDRDEDLFAYMALFNDNLLLNKQCRSQLQDFLSEDLQHVYAKRCAQLKGKFRWFDPAPVTVDVGEEPAESAQPVDASMLHNLAAQVTHLKASVSGISKTLLWGFIVVGALVLWHR